MRQKGKIFEHINIKNKKFLQLLENRINEEVMQMYIKNMQKAKCK